MAYVKKSKIEIESKKIVSSPLTFFFFFFFLPKKKMRLGNKSTIQLNHEKSQQGMVGLLLGMSV
jgi:hypothetical protein